jgi:hypothetical protein
MYRTTIAMGSIRIQAMCPSPTTDPTSLDPSVYRGGPIFGRDFGRDLDRDLRGLPNFDRLGQSHHFDQSAHRRSVPRRRSVLRHPRGRLRPHDRPHLHAPQ